MENANRTGRQLRKSLKLQNIGGDGLKPKKVRLYTPNLNVVRRKVIPDIPRKPPLKDNERPASEDGNVKKTMQTAEVFFEGSSNFRSLKRLRNHKTKDSENNPKKPKKRSILSSSDEEESADNKAKNNKGLQEVKDDDKIFTLEPLELAHNVMRSFKNMMTTECASSTQSHEACPSEELKVKQEEEEAVPHSLFMQDRIYSKERPILTVFKLPDYISIKSTNNGKTSKPMGVCLKDLSEGKLGTLTIRRSGRMQAQIGRIRYEVDDVNYQTESTQVSSFSNRNGESNLFNLGSVREWFNLVPAWDDFVVK